MSRSRRKNPVMGQTTTASEKKDKRFNNRKIRRAVKIAIENGDEIIPDKKELTDPWVMGKDGKQRFDPDLHSGKWMRK